MVFFKNLSRGGKVEIGKTPFVIKLYNLFFNDYQFFLRYLILNENSLQLSPLPPEHIQIISIICECFFSLGIL